MWFTFALLSAIFAALTSILAKIGISGVNSNLATAIRTIVVLLMAWGMVFLTNAQKGISEISKKSWLFLILSGLATGASWLCYFKALQKGNINKVVPIDKSSTVLTIILATIFLGETITLYKILGIIAIGAGTLMMVEKKEMEKSLRGADRDRVFADSGRYGSVAFDTDRRDTGTAVEFCGCDEQIKRMKG